jgi:hypothetical protein
LFTDWACVYPLFFESPHNSSPYERAWHLISQDEHKLTILKKKLQSVITICRAYHKQSGLLQAFADCEHFSSMEPVVDSFPCPGWLRHEKHKLRVLSASTVPDFWKLIAQDLPDIDAEFRKQLVSDRIVEVVRRDDGKVVATLRELTAASSYAAAELSLPDGFKDGLAHVQAVACFEDLNNFEVLGAALAYIKESSNVLGSSLMSYPAGRSLIASAQKRTDKFEKELKEAQVYLGYIEGLDSTMPEGFVSAGADWLAIAAAWKVLGAFIVGTIVFCFVVCRHRVFWRTSCLLYTAVGREQGGLR